MIRRSGRAADLVSVEALYDRPEGACHRTAVSRTSGSASERRRCGRTHPCPAASPLCLHRRRQEPNAVSKGRDCGQRQHGAGGRGRRGRTAVLELFVLHPEVVPLLVAKLLGRGGGRSAAAPAQFLTGAQRQMSARRGAAGEGARRWRRTVRLWARLLPDRDLCSRLLPTGGPNGCRLCATASSGARGGALPALPRLGSMVVAPQTRRLPPGGLPSPRRAALTRAVETCRRALR